MKNKILKHFQDEYVVVAIKNLSMTTIDPETGMTLSDNASLNGFLIDIDKDNLYIGDDIEVVAHIIPRENIGFIGLAKHNLEGFAEGDIKMPDGYNGELN